MRNIDFDEIIILIPLGVTLLSILCVVVLLVSQFFPYSIQGKYSVGTRTGLITKLSEKGLICKTYEGQMLVGNGNNIQPETFLFTIKNEDIANKVMSKIGETASLEYNQKFYSSKCFGDTSYEIVNIK